ncbi:MAG: SAV_2336 N-terminal domain-related protein, partial [Rhizonema sp. PD38]|nr:SAV_2336 N-terminal domain-related protein [Rhizonema sp. PD38]
MIKRLIDRLFLSKLLEINQVDSSGILHSLALNDEDIADSIWLALQMGVVDIPPKSMTSEQETNNKIIDDQVVESIHTSPQKDVVNVYTQDQKNNLINQKQEQTTPTAGFPFQVPAAPTIQNSLEIGRAMRPLKRKFPSTTKVILDEEATVTRIIERNIWLPVTKPKPERWLDLELVVEESRSSFIWQEMIDEFQKILENHGAFASVRVWTIKSQSQQQDNSKSSNLILTRRRKQSNLEQRQHKHRELIHPNKRGLTLLISDCVSPLWHNQTIYEWLKDWSEGQPTAIVQLFPERLWESTQLSLGRKLFANALNPGATNPKLVLF